jgi:hypothetical protein
MSPGGILRLRALARTLRHDAVEIRQIHAVSALRRADELDSYADEIEIALADADFSCHAANLLAARGWDEV